MNRLLGLLIALFTATGSARAVDPQEQAKEKAAELQARSLVASCGAYAAHPANKLGEKPKKLADLVAPPFVNISFLKNGKADLLDPWGKEFKYELVEIKKGEKVAYVWAERDVNGKTKVYGKAPPKKKS